MKKYLISLVIASLAVLAIGQTLVNYQNTYTSGLACMVGRLQSPVALTDTNSYYNVTVYPVFSNYLPVPDAKLAWSSNGRILEVVETGTNTMNSWGYMGLERSGILKQYLLKSIEINFPGEHTVEGVTPDIEVKLIHEKSLSFQTTVNQYRKIPDGNSYLIISLLYKKDGSVPDNGLISELVNSYTSGSFNMDLEAYNLIPNKKFFFYEGSFTSDPCDEVANHIVIRNFFKLTDSAYTFFQTQYQSKYVNGIAAKNTADLYGRHVYRNYALNSTEASSSFINFSYLLAFIFVFIF